MENTILENEKNIIAAIKENIKENGEKGKNVVGYMLQSGNLRNNQRTIQKSEGFIITTEPDKKRIFFEENDGIIEITYVYNENDAQVAITYDKKEDQIAYYSHLGFEGHNLLALASREGTEIPMYGKEFDLSSGLKKLKKIGEFIPEKPGSTIRENIEMALLQNPTLSLYADEILSAFDKILSLDRERQIKPLSQNELEIAKLRRENAALKEEKEAVESENAALKEEKEAVESEKEAVESENAALKEGKQAVESENRAMKEQIEGLQKMLKTVLNFVGRVQKSPAGRIFFGKQINKLKDEQEKLPEATGR